MLPESPALASETRQQVAGALERRRRSVGRITILRPGVTTKNGASSLSGFLPCIRRRHLGPTSIFSKALALREKKTTTHTREKRGCATADPLALRTAVAAPHHRRDQGKPNGVRSKTQLPRFVPLGWTCSSRGAPGGRELHRKSGRGTSGRIVESFGFNLRPWRRRGVASVYCVRW
jgi:hypothetical protein